MSYKMYAVVSKLEYPLFLFLLLFLIIHLFYSCKIKRVDIMENYKKHKEDIIKVELFFRQKEPLYVEFNNENSIDIIIRRRIPNTDLSEVYFNAWDVNISDIKVARALNDIGWSVEDLRRLYYLLKEANCISIGYVDRANIGYKDVVEIGYKKSWPQKYVYLIFPQDISKEEMEILGEGITDKIIKLDKRIGWCVLRGGFG